MQLLGKQLEQEKKEKDMLEAKIRAMESKVLQGGVNLLEKVGGNWGGKEVEAGQDT